MFGNALHLCHSEHRTRCIYFTQKLFVAIFKKKKNTKTQTIVHLLIPNEKPSQFGNVKKRPIAHTRELLRKKHVRKNPRKAKRMFCFILVFIPFNGFRLRERVRPEILLLFLSIQVEEWKKIRCMCVYCERASVRMLYTDAVIWAAFIACALGHGTSVGHTQ